MVTILPLSPKLIPRALKIFNYWEGIFKRCGWEKKRISFLIGYCVEGDQSKGTSVEKSITEAFTQTKQDTVKVLEELVREGAKKMLWEALEIEIA